jgi:hypothetical protein
MGLEEMAESDLVLVSHDWVQVAFNLVRVRIEA